MIGEAAVWAIFLLPLASFLIIALLIRPFLNRYAQLSGILLVACLGAALALAAWTLRSTLAGPLEFEPHPWLALGQATIEMGLLVDPLTAIMLVVVTGVSLLVQIYSLGYLRHDPGYARYFAYMSLFTTAMLGLVLASNIIQLYVFWEMVGLGSYLLIGFWHERPAAAAAAKKAFIITRIGDVGFLIAILYLFLQAEDFARAGLNPFHIPDIWEAARPVAAAGAGILGGTALTWVALGIFSGAAGKSAQFPLHTWLPDAMEGPTPVSALIHAATMVAAGVFLVARFYPLFQEADYALTVVALVGAFTALMAATLALVMTDIKRVLAYSTISQLGYMMAALGVGAYGPALFHLVTHASFKALLFLGAGNASHATGTFDLRFMGGLRRSMPWTYLLMGIGALSLAGVIPLAGFWSKDEILALAWKGTGPVGLGVSRTTFALLIIGALLTAFYSLRLVHLAFHGRFRGGMAAELEARAQPAAPGTAQAPSAPTEAHLGESPAVMVWPMVVLAAAAALSGYLANPQWAGLLGVPRHWINEFLLGGLARSLPAAPGHPELPGFSLGMAVVSSLVALAGIGCATTLYLGRRKGEARDPLEGAGPVHALLTQRYYVDQLYENLMVRRVFYRRFAGTIDWLDRNLVDGLVDLVGWVFRNVGRALAQLQTGQVQFYGVVVALGSVLIVLAFLVSR